MAMKLDLYDKKIMYELDLNSRVSATEIAKKIKLPKETVNYRIKRLVKNKYIKSFYALVNASKLGYYYYEIFLKFYKLPSDKETEIISFIREQPQCSSLRILEGDFDMSFVSMHKHPLDVGNALRELNPRFGKYILNKSIHSVITIHKLNQKMLVEGETQHTIYRTGETSDYDVDEIDRQIINTLSTDARTKLIDLARCLGQDAQMIKYRIKKLEENGIIVGYSTSLNLEKFNRFVAQVNIKVNDYNKIKSMIEFFDQSQTCMFAFEMLGEHDLSLELYVEDEEQLRYLMKRFNDIFLDSYIDYEVLPIYRDYLMNWSPLPEEGGNNC